MKRLMSIMAVCLAITCTMAPIDAYAKKFGGGNSFGRSYKTTQSQPQSAPSGPSQQQSVNQNQASKSSAQQPQQQKKSGLFGGMMGGLLGGLLAGTLLGSLLGGAGFGGIGLIDILLIAGLGFLAFKLLKRKRAQTAGASSSSFGSSIFGQNDSFGSDGFRAGQNQQTYQQDNRSTFSHSEGNTDANISSTYKGESSFGDGYRSPDNTNNAGFAQSGFGAGDEVPFTLPPDFDLTGFVRRARDHYRIIQDAWNRGDMSAIKEYVAPELYQQLVAERNSLQGDQHTEVMYVDAEVVRADYLSGKGEVSLRFSGRYRDNVERVEENIADIWHLEQSRPGAPWLITGIENATE